jgi:type IV secretory pathway TrbL component
MLEDATGRLVSGALWGLAAGLVLTLTRGGGEGLRSVAKGAIKGYLTVADRVQEATAEMRENIDDVAAEVRAERAAAPEPHLPGASTKP